MVRLRRIYGKGNIDFYSVSTESDIKIPFIDGGISAGFPSPAEDFIDISIDLNKTLIKNPPATFIGRVNGDSMKDLGIGDGDLIIIDKSLEPKNGKIAVCYIDGEFTLKKIKLENNRCFLMPANKKYKPIEVTEDNDLVIWGILVHTIKSF